MAWTSLSLWTTLSRGITDVQDILVIFVEGLLNMFYAFIWRNVPNFTSANFWCRWPQGINDQSPMLFEI